VLVGLDFSWVLFVWVGEGDDVFVAEESIVIEVEFGVDGDDLAVGVGVGWVGDDEWVYFCE